MRILVVEDEALIAEEIQDRLTRLGFRVVGVRDTAEQAIQAANDLLPDQVLMDIRLKGESDGIYAAEQIYGQLEIPVIYLTAHSDQATLNRAKATAPFGYILKPFQEKDLLVTIEMASQRHALEQRLKASELRYATMLASIADGVMTTDTDARINFMNPVAQSLTGWKFADADGLMIEQVCPLVDEASRTAIDHPVREALARQAVVGLSKPCLLLERGGSDVLIDDGAAIIRDAQGTMTGAVVAFRDIRPRRLAEVALRKAEEQLRQAQKMEAIGRLAGGVAHDFNNLLTVILGYSDLLQGSKHLDEDEQSIIAQITKAGERAADLIRQLLAYSRKQVLHPVVLDVNDLVAELEKMLGRLIGEDIRLTTTLSTMPALVKADPGQIEQVILNLAVNARDAMPRGGQLNIGTRIIDIDKTVTSTRPEMGPGRYVLLSLRDTGMGMDKETLSHLFEPFFTTKGVGKGTGLGLATVYGIVKQSEGHIFAYSEPGYGTTFKIYLPLVVDAAATDLDTSPSLPVRQGHETILLVEDDDAVRSVTLRALKDCGYNVLAACNGEEALRICAEYDKDIQLLLTDVVMPNMNGRQLAERLIELRPTIPILYMSGYTVDSVIHDGVLAGEVAYIQKPFTTIALARKVRELLD